MCLAVPMLIVSIEGDRAVVENHGVEARVSLDLTPEAGLGDFVLVHAGFAIQTLTENEARETLEIFERLEASWEKES
jgi:hydrogenase expression/formation protein HypC